MVPFKKEKKNLSILIGTLVVLFKILFQAPCVFVCHVVVVLQLTFPGAQVLSSQRTHKINGNISTKYNQHQMMKYSTLVLRAMEKKVKNFL